jgi:hypothetical protein
MFGSALASGLGFFTPASTRGGGGGRCTFVSLRFGFAIAASRVARRQLVAHRR